MKDFFTFAFKVAVGIYAVLLSITHEWTSIKDLLVNNGIVSFSQEGITIIPLANIRWYILGLLISCIAVLCFMGYRYFRSGHRFELSFLLVMWLAYVSTITFMLSRPVPWYGLGAGLLALTFLLWIFIRVAFPPDFKHSKLK